ncbi:MAG: hypothetical protein WA097_07180 [Candidatus Hydromicrobium sp.]
MKDKMKALLCYSQSDFRIEDIEKPKISDDEVLMEMIYWGYYNLSTTSIAIFAHSHSLSGL